MAAKNKTTQVKDLLAEVLDEVQPIGTIRIGDREIAIWPVDYISVEHRLVYFDAQTDAMLRYQELQNVQDKLQKLYAIAEKTEEQETEVKTLASRIQSLQQEIAPLVCSYIEALAEQPKDTLLPLLKEEVEKRAAKKNLPMSLFINKLSQQVGAWTEAKEKAEEESSDGDTESPKTVEAEVVTIEDNKQTSTSEA